MSIWELIFFSNQGDYHQSYDSFQKNLVHLRQQKSEIQAKLVQLEEDENEQSVHSIKNEARLTRIRNDIDSFIINALNEQESTFKKDAPGLRRLADNIAEITTAIGDVLDDTKMPWEKARAVNILQYQASRWEPAFAWAKKIVRTLCAALFGFILGAATGAALTGGIATLPNAILLSFQSTVAAYAGVGAASASIGPLFAAAAFARDEIAQKTNSPIEKGMLQTQRSLMAYLDIKPQRTGLMASIYGFFGGDTHPITPPENNPSPVFEM